MESEDVMDDNLRAALELLISRDDEGRLFDREADEGGYRSKELEAALDVIRTAVAKA
jgi:hypothetical protein